MAEGLLRHHLRAGGYGGRFEAGSAGTTDHYEGQRAAALVREEVRRRTACEFDHRPHRARAEEIEGAALILAMAAEHREWIAREHPGALSRTVLLAAAVDGEFDVPDPGVMDAGLLAPVAELIERCVREGLGKIVEWAGDGAEGGIRTPTGAWPTAP